MGERAVVPSGGMPAEPGTRRFRVGDVPPLAEGFTDRPDTARGIVDAVVPGASVALVPGSAFAEGPQNWLGACGKTQIAVIIAESLWRSAAIDILIWGNATSRACGVDRGALRQLAERHQPAVAGGVRRPARFGRPGRALAGRPGRPGPGHQPPLRGHRAPRHAGHAGRVLQRPRGAELPDRTAEREPGAAARRH